MKVLSLFSGVGGFDMGLENAGMETVFQCEWDKHANSILHRHWPDVPKWDDVSTLTGKHILAHAPVVDVVAWGSPCQDLSVAGKRAGLEGGRSGLFHEGIRIIKELQEETNGQYPGISIWENVVGALNSNRGADFGIILNEMAEAGAVAIEWAVLDAQYFGVPQRRRRVFVIAIFDPVLANRCPSPLLPVAESLPGHLAKSKPQRKSATPKTSESVGTDGETVGGLTVCDLVKGQTSHQALEQNFLQVVEDRQPFTSTSFADYEEGVGTLRSMSGDLGGGSKTLVTEPFVKSSRAQTSEDSETWIPGEVNPTLNSFDVGDTRATTAIVEPMLAFDTQFGSNANVTEDVAPTLKSSQQSPSVAYPIDTRNALRDPEKYDAQNRQGLGIGNDGDPMATLTSAHVNGVAVQYDGYNQRVNETDVSLTIRIGRDSSDFIAQPTEPTVFQPGTMVRLGGGVWDGTVPTLRAEAKRGDNEPHIAIHGGEPTMAVRRLTPLECERLMGWPDDHTRYKADGTEQADTHRYKQCGNGVASPVAQWIAKHILAI
jgi:DNA (cytosine-5)-methyltransferase 1